MRLSSRCSGTAAQPIEIRPCDPLFNVSAWRDEKRAVFASIPEQPGSLQRPHSVMGLPGAVYRGEMISSELDKVIQWCSMGRCYTARRASDVLRREACARFERSAAR